MGHHEDCANWEYSSHPKRGVLSERCDALTRAIVSRTTRFQRYSFDTRRGHRFMFRGLAPQDCPCLAGKYRGDGSCNHLAKYNVQIGADPRVGVPYYQVTWYLEKFEAQCLELMNRHASLSQATGKKITPELVLVRFVGIACELLEQFFAIHPYANGNGHAGRLLLWVLMCRGGYPPARWPLDESPDYGHAISSYRDGNKAPLETFMLRAIAGL